MSHRFETWTTTHGLVSSFKSHHRTTPRFTYERGGVQTALDDIYVSGEHESIIVSSGIWLRSLVSSDHVGTPFVVLRCERGARIAATVHEITPIKVVSTRDKTSEEMTAFTIVTDKMLGDGKITLIEDIDPATTNEAEILDWLERAIANMNECLYTSAKELWGESNQSRRQLARSVSVKRSNRCTAQLRQIQQLTELPEVCANDLINATNAVHWPKWVARPDLMVEGSAHEHGTRNLVMLLACPPHERATEAWVAWVRTIIKQWRQIMRTRRNWRQTQRQIRIQEQRQTWFSGGCLKKFLRSTLGNQAPPVTIRSALVSESTGFRYTESRSEVQAELTKLLDNWIPADEKTESPRFLETLAADDVDTLPAFARDWILPDIERGGRYAEYWRQENNTWEEYVYTEEMQTDIDRNLKQHVAPGFGGISQEMWIAAPATIRARERRVIELILRIGKAPPILRRKQMIFLPKAANIDPTLDNSRGLPPWRPITVQAAFASRLLLIIKRYVDPGIPISLMQHGFQTDRTVIDAALLVTLLTERAVALREHLLMVSKDCLKCFDRIQKWCMDLIYRGIGVPDMPRKLMIDLLGPGEIEVRTAFGWLSTGSREFGIGQGSILSILHIACYMDCLQQQLERCPDPVKIKHHQPGEGIELSSTLFVDDQLDITTTYRGIEARSAVTNIFTGKLGTGGVFGAAKSFMMYLGNKDTHYDAVMLNDGLSIPLPVRIVAPAEGFKHLGIYQGGSNMWEATIAPTWAQLTEDASRIQHMRLSLAQLRYIVNGVWIPRMRYRMILGGALSVAGLVDTFIRQVARTVLRLPFATPRDVYYDKVNGLGLDSCELDANIYRLQEALRILNDPNLPVRHVLIERLEAYQVNAGITAHPLSDPVLPPVQVTTWEAQIIRFASKLEPPLRIVTKWNQPPATQSFRSNDRPLLGITPRHLQRVLIAVNWNTTFKLQYVGDICGALGKQLLTRRELQLKGGWNGAKRGKVDQLYVLWKEQLVNAGTLTLCEPVGCEPVPQAVVPYQVRIGVGEWIVAVKLDLAGPEPQILHHELGYRDIGDPQRSALGRVIPVRWWYERPRGSDIWYERRHRRREDEYEGVCVPVTPTYLPRSARRQDRIILWNTTEVEGMRGVNDVVILREAQARSLLRYNTTLIDGHPLEMLTACTECGRHRGEQWCLSCGHWHHPNCIRGECRTPFSYSDDVDDKRDASAQYAWSNEPGSSIIQVGDGSVTAANTPSAKGGWAFQAPGGNMVMGQLHIHCSDISSTRCEVHALLAGLILYGDTGEQVCDNKSAIAIFNKARALVNGKLKHLKYRDVHRIEIRSLSRAMRRDGSMRVVWVGSHRESEFTADNQLRQRRQALAIVDAAATESHHYSMMASYASWLLYDDYMLEDEDGNLVFGNTLQYLQRRVANDQRKRWMHRQDHKADVRRTMSMDEVSMIESKEWTEGLRRFYWRARRTVLHTNAVKNRFDARWPDTCAVCEQGNETNSATLTPDTQDHRFGLSLPKCSDVDKLQDRLTTMYYAIEREQWLPDQSVLLPAISDTIAAATGHEQRTLWASDDVRAIRWRPMMQISADLWANAQWLEWFGDPSELSEDNSFVAWLLREQMQPPTGVPGCLLPQNLVTAVQLIHTQIGFFQAYLTQWVPGWAAVTFQSGVPFDAFPGLMQLMQPPDIETWWIDDIFRPHSGGWWSKFQRIFEHQIRQTSPVYWIATYYGEEGHMQLEAMGCTWVLKIPVQQLQMRSERTVVQGSRLPRRCTMFVRNEKVILIGVLARPEEVTDLACNSVVVWIEVLRKSFTAEWLLPEWGDLAQDEQAPPIMFFCHPVLDWAAIDTAVTRHPPWWTYVRQQLDRLLLGVYKAPKGWRRYPTMTKQSVIWSEAVSYTSTQARQLHDTLFHRTWATLYDYWKYSCTRQDNMPVQQERETLRNEVNNGIKTRRRNWTRRTQATLAGRIQGRRGQVQQRGHRWHDRRNRALVEQRHSEQSGPREEGFMAL